MLESAAYCVDVLKQTHAVRRAIEKLETVLLEGHLRSCVGTGVREGREDQVVGELIELYQVSNR
jgi:DNA-binding FrmR family transcriptional regulator